ncbi:Pentatricopeptide repeat-containing protein [Actinidia chinensis var. chinensis]|uniref:Pentatricopeptide repeat-containing protein n=1 Tax=Actinidia chinensis var. chinensis TaxID=1590841 RepID=A0A2R6QNR7_ACTCC|nr:Pentatricopeptide repeat-containing protein [Actinidia chinensis var. chinensis]
MRCYISVPLINLFWVLGSLFGLVFNPVTDTVHICIAKLVNYLIFIKNPRIVTDVIEAYRVEGYLVGVKAFKVVLNLCRKANLADEGLWVLRKMKEMNCQPDTPAYHVVIGLFCEKGDMDVAAELMREFGSLFGLVFNPVTDTVHRCIAKLVNYLIFIKNPRIVTDVIEAYRVEGYLVGVKAFKVVLNLCRKANLADEGLWVLRKMKEMNCQPDTPAYHVVIGLFCEKGDMDVAAELMREFGLVNLIKKLEEAENLFRWMVASAVKPDGLASSTMMKRLCLEVRVLDGFCLYCELEELDFLSSIDLDIYSILLSVLCKESCMVEAAKLARLMVERRIPLKSLYVDNIVEHLRNSGEKDLVSHLTGVEKLYGAKSCYVFCSGTALIILNMFIRSWSDGLMVMLQARGRWSVTGFSIEQTSLRLMLIALAVLHKEHEFCCVIAWLIFLPGFQLSRSERSSF